MTHFDQIANEWDSPEKVKLITTTANKIKENLELKHNLKMMDFGCGTGLLSENFIDYSSEFLGVDTSSGMLEVFNQKFKNNPNVHSKNINLEVENFKGNYDLIISSMAFHHLSTPERVLKKMKEMLNEDGKIAIVDLDKEDGTFHPDNEGMGVKHFGFSEDEIVSWSTECGFSVLTHSIIHKMKKNGKSYSLFLAVFEK